MDEGKQRSGEDRRHGIERREVSDRREFNLLLYKLLIYDSPDKRRASDRRKIKSAK
jgi:hypothetical protein